MWEAIVNTAIEAGRVFTDCFSNNKNYPHSPLFIASMGRLLGSFKAAELLLKKVFLLKYHQFLDL